MSEPSNTSTDLNQSQQHYSRPYQIISQLFAYYRGREEALVNLLYQYGATQTDIAQAMGVDPSLVSRNYPKGGKK